MKAALDVRALGARLTSGAVGGLGLLLLPKCPLCLAALLSAAGLGAGLASCVASLLRPIAVGLMGLALLGVALAARRSLSRSRAASTIHGCCSRPSALSE
jgi:hypothetical protein